MKSMKVRKRVQGPWMNAPAEVDYWVIEVHNAVDPSPGDTLTEQQFANYCHDTNWDVAVVSG